MAADKLEWKKLDCYQEHEPILKNLFYSKQNSNVLFIEQIRKFFVSPVLPAPTPTLTGISLSKSKVSLLSCSAQEPPFPILTFLKEKNMKQSKLLSLALSAVKWFATVCRPGRLEQ